MVFIGHMMGYERRGLQDQSGVSDSVISLRLDGDCLPSPQRAGRCTSIPGCAIGLADGVYGDFELRAEAAQLANSRQSPSISQVWRLLVRVTTFTPNLGPVLAGIQGFRDRARVFVIGTLCPISFCRG